jgi:hypothetical protein
MERHNVMVSLLLQYLKLKLWIVFDVNPHFHMIKYEKMGKCGNCARVEKRKDEKERLRSITM